MHKLPAEDFRVVGVEEADTALPGLLSFSFSVWRMTYVTP